MIHKLRLKCRVGFGHDGWGRWYRWSEPYMGVVKLKVLQSLIKGCSLGTRSGVGVVQ